MKFLISGGGICGLMMAIVLEKKGYEVAVYEAATEIKAVGAGLVLSTNAIKALKYIGVEKAILAAGNINGVAQVEANIQSPEVAQEPEFYEVKSGDTLSKIAREAYGDANRYPEIFEANKPMLSHPDKIYPGQNLRIPRDEKAAA